MELLNGHWIRTDEFGFGRTPREREGSDLRRTLRPVPILEELLDEF
jgi:hypothetical protein